MVIISTVRDFKNDLHVFTENTVTQTLTWTFPNGSMEGVSPDIMGIHGDAHGRIIARTLQALIETSPKYFSVEISK